MCALTKISSMSFQSIWMENSDKLSHLENIKQFIYLFDKVKIQKIP